MFIVGNPGLCVLWKELVVTPYSSASFSVFSGFAAAPWQAGFALLRDTGSRPDMNSCNDAALAKGVLDRAIFVGFWVAM